MPSPISVVTLPKILTRVTRLRKDEAHERADQQGVDALISAAREADLFIAEAYFWERKVKYHLDWVTLKSHLDEIRAKRVILTHMSADMLGRSIEDSATLASDGMVVEV